MALAAECNARSLRHRVGDMLFDFGNGLLVDQGTLIGRALQAVAHAQFADRRTQFLGKFLVHAFLHQQSLGAHEGWPVLRYLRAMPPSTAASKSASSNTMR